MSTLAVVASLLLGAASDQHEGVLAPLVADEVGNGPVIELDVFVLSGGLTASSQVGTGSAVLVSPAVQVGWEFDQNAILIGAQMTFVNGGGDVLIFPITYRRYMKALKVNNFDPFVEGAATFNLVIPNGGSVNVGFGINAGFGGEWLFTQHFGLLGKVLLGFQHIPAAFSSPITGAGADINSFGFGGVLGVLVHF
jgi:hypothetical protein